MKKLFKTQSDVKTAYRKFEKIYKQFIKACDENDILVKGDFACCRTCGGADIHQLATHLNNTENKYYEATAFYHDQNKSSMFETFTKGQTTMSTHLYWGYLDWEHEGDDDCSILGNKFKHLAESVGARLTFENASTALLFEVDL